MKRVIQIGTLLVAAMFPSIASASTFTDVNKDAWYYPYIIVNEEKGIIKGYDDGTFHPNDPITRAQAAKIISRMIELPEIGNYQPKFRDVTINHSNYEEIVILTKMGIFDNRPFFHPNGYLTRAQMAKIIVTMYQFDIDKQAKPIFRDIPSNYWAKPYIAFLAKHAITTGVTRSIYSPTTPVTRAQILALLERSANYKKNSETNVVLFDPYVNEYITIKQANEMLSFETIALINNERVKMGLAPLEEQKKLSQIAFIKAKNMIDMNYFEHTSPLYGKPWDMAGGFNFPYKTFGENIAHGYKDANTVVAAWMNSEKHRANILNPKFTTIGVGIAVNSAQEYYYVHMFSSN